MFRSYFNFMTRTGKMLPFLKETALYRKMVPHYARLRTLYEHRGHTPVDDAIAFYTKNAVRVNAVANMLADERSRKEYLGIIKFRQSHQKKDFPLCDGKLPEYFIEEVTFGKDEVFLDCGAYIGDTLDVFVKRCPNYANIVAFEPDKKNFALLTQKYGNNPKITLMDIGVYDADGESSFAERGLKSNSAITDKTSENTACISIKAIDNLNLKNVSFVKMDIEGAELPALKGAKKTIARDKPKLAICIYHSDEDMLSIAEYIHALVPEYKLYVRHHRLYPMCGETVLYAVMPY